MKCPRCQATEFKVLDTRQMDGSIRRRRECESCGYRFNTFETIEQPTLLVIKKDETREVFDREKVLTGVIRSAQKRPISLERMEELVEQVERQIRGRGESEVSSNDIGQVVMDLLAELDEITYIRFASVYRSFKDVSELEDLLKQITKK